jgi:zinc transport system permease protein
MTWVRIDLMGLLFGDILAVSKNRYRHHLCRRRRRSRRARLIWKPLFAATVNPGTRRGRGHEARPRQFHLHAASGRRDRHRDEDRRRAADHCAADNPGRHRAPLRRAGRRRWPSARAIAGVLSVVAGLYGSLQWDTPSGPSIVVAALILFRLSLFHLGRIARRRSAGPPP